MTITITEQQLKILKPYTYENYISELIEHCDKFFPHLNPTIGEENLRQVLRDAVEKAKQSGFTQRGPVQFYIDLLIVFGWGFETDPQYPWIKESLEKNNHLYQIEKADSLFFTARDYLKKISGENNKYDYIIAETLKNFNFKDYLKILTRSEEQLFDLFYAVYPQKIETFGIENFKKILIEKNKKIKSTFSDKSSEWYLLVLFLEFLYGHQFDNDPFLPFASMTIKKADQYIDGTYYDSDQNETAKMESLIKSWGNLKVYYTY